MESYHKPGDTQVSLCAQAQDLRIIFFLLFAHLLFLLHFYFLFFPEDASLLPISSFADL